MAECEQLRSLNAQLLASKKQLEERARASDVGLVELVSQIKQDATDRANNRIRDVHLEWQAKLEAARQEWNADKQQEMARLVKVPNRRSPRTQAFSVTHSHPQSQPRPHTHPILPRARPQVDMRAHTSARYGSRAAAHKGTYTYPPQAMHKSRPRDTASQPHSESPSQPTASTSTMASTAITVTARFPRPADCHQLNFKLNRCRPPLTNGWRTLWLRRLSTRRMVV